jgi:hypothetical protein
VNQLTFKIVKDQCRALTPIQQQNICRLVLSLTTGPADDEPVETWHALVLWVADTLTRVRICTPDQLMLLLPVVRDGILQFAVKLDTYLERCKAGEQGVSLVAHHLGFCDRRYVTLTGLDTLLDLQTGEVVDKLPVKPLETVGYDLVALYIRRVAECDAVPEAETNAADNTENETAGSQDAAAVG